MLTAQIELPTPARLIERHATAWRGYVYIEGSDRPIDCTVKDYSSAGALLEFTGMVPECDAFVLLIANFDHEIACEVTHRRGASLGVTFPSATARTGFADPDDRNEGLSEADDAILLLLSTLADIPEFSHCGFSAQLGEGGDSVMICREGRVRGSWAKGPTGLLWVSSSASSAMAADDAGEAARITLMMVLNMLRVRRAKAAHERTVTDARSAVGLAARRR